jgi:hypothetical protein
MALGSLSVDTLNTSTGVFASNNAVTGIAKAWVNFTYSSGITINSSFNVSSMSRTTTGDYTINFTTAMPSTNYGVLGTTMCDATLSSPAEVIGIYSSSGVVNGKNTTSVRILVKNQSFSTQDPADATVCIVSA